MISLLLMAVLRLFGSLEPGGCPKNLAYILLKKHIWDLFTIPFHDILLREFQSHESHMHQRRKVLARGFLGGFFTFQQCACIYEFLITWGKP